MAKSKETEKSNIDIATFNGAQPQKPAKKAAKKKPAKKK